MSLNTGIFSSHCSLIFRSMESEHLQIHLAVFPPRSILLILGPSCCEELLVHFLRCEVPACHCWIEVFQMLCFMAKYFPASSYMLTGSDTAATVKKSGEPLWSYRVTDCRRRLMKAPKTWRFRHHLPVPLDTSASLFVACGAFALFFFPSFPFGRFVIIR